MVSLKNNNTILEEALSNIEAAGEVSRDYGYSAGDEQGYKMYKLYNCQNGDASSMFVRDRRPFYPYNAFSSGYYLLPEITTLSSFYREYGSKILFKIYNPAEVYAIIYLKGTLTYQHSSGATIPVVQYRTIVIPKGGTYYGSFIEKFPGGNYVWEIEIEGLFYSHTDQVRCYKITYDFGNGTTLSDLFNDDRYVYFAPGSDKAPTANRYFRGWNTKKDGTGIWVQNYISSIQDAIEDEVTLYAIWGYEYTVTFRKTESASSQSSTKTYRGTTSSFRITMPTAAELGIMVPPAGYSSFKNWGHRPQGYITSINAGASYTLSGNKIFFAQWN